MKKTYRKPQVLVAVIENEMILAGSLTEGENNLGNEPVDGSKLLGKRGVLNWDEE